MLIKYFSCLVIITFLGFFDLKAQTNLSQQFLEAHNKIRKEVGLPPLKWSNKLANHAKDWANHLKNANCTFRHRPNNQYGENLAMRWSSNWGSTKPSPQSFVSQWYREKPAFDKHFLDKRGNVINTCCNNYQRYGHYSQIVWEKTTEVGCAIVKCSNGKYICVCNYDPAGNMMNDKPFKKVK